METSETPQESTQQQPTMAVKPQKEHQWLQKFLGEWTFEGEMTMEPGKPAEKFSGHESVRSVGDFWILGEGQAEMPGGETGTMLTTIGFDPQTKRYVGTVFYSMMPHLWIYDGELDGSERVLTLRTEGPDMGTEGKMAKFKDVVEFMTDDHRVLTSYMLGDNGEWRPVMTGHYRREKQPYSA